MMVWNPHGGNSQTLINSFGANGIVSNTFSSTSKSILKQSDGNLIVGGTMERVESSDFEIARYTAAGAPDIRFGVNLLTR